MLELLVFIFYRTFQPVVTVKIHDDAALVETVMALGKVCLHDEAEILLSRLHLQHRSIIIAEMIIRSLPEVRVWCSRNGKSISVDAETLWLACPL